MIRINARIQIDECEIEETFLRASGPGGQNVNKVATAVELRFDAIGSRALPEDVRARLANLAGRRLTQDGVLIITARRHRTQERNRQDARARLIALLRRAATPPARRIATRPTAASKKRRIEGKRRRSAIKSLRSEQPIAD